MQYEHSFPATFSNCSYTAANWLGRFKSEYNKLRTFREFVYSFPSLSDENICIIVLYIWNLGALELEMPQCLEEACASLKVSRSGRRGARGAWGHF